jgi:hypothetical protein
MFPIAMSLPKDWPFSSIAPSWFATITTVSSIVCCQYACVQICLQFHTTLQICTWIRCHDFLLHFRAFLPLFLSFFFCLLKAFCFRVTEFTTFAFLWHTTIFCNFFGVMLIYHASFECGSLSLSLGVAICWNLRFPKDFNIDALSYLCIISWW